MAEQSAQNHAVSPPPSDHDGTYSDDDGTTSSSRRKRRTGSQGGSPSKKKNLLKMPAWTQAGYDPDKPGESSKGRALSAKPERNGKSRTPAPAAASVPATVQEIFEIDSDSDSEISMLPSAGPSRAATLAGPLPAAASQSLGLRSGQAALRQQQDIAYNPYIHPPLEEEAEDDDIPRISSRQAEIDALLAVTRAGKAKTSAGEEDHVTDFFGKEPLPDVEILVTLQWHVGEQEGAAISVKAKEVLLKKRSFKMQTSQSIELVYDFILQTIGHPKDKVRLAYNGTRIWVTSGSLQQLKIYKDCQIDGYSQQGWAEMEQRERDEKKRLAAQPDENGDEQNESGADGRAGPSTVNANESEAAQTGETFSLTLRGAAGSINVKVKHTTKLSSLVKHYADKMGITDSSTLRIEWDGEHPDLEETVADLDAENEDMLNVV